MAMYNSRHHRPTTPTWGIPKGLWSHPLALLLWSILCLIIGVRLLRSALSARQAFSTKTQAEQILQDEEKKGAKLMEQVNQADQALSQEKIIRDELNLQKPGEIILQLPTPVASSQ